MPLLMEIRGQSQEKAKFMANFYAVLRAALRPEKAGRCGLYAAPPRMKADCLPRMKADCPVPRHKNWHGLCSLVGI